MAATVNSISKLVMLNQYMDWMIAWVIVSMLIQQLGSCPVQYWWVVNGDQVRTSCTGVETSCKPMNVLDCSSNLGLNACWTSVVLPVNQANLHVQLTLDLSSSNVVVSSSSSGNHQFMLACQLNVNHDVTNRLVSQCSLLLCGNCLANYYSLCYPIIHGRQASNKHGQWVSSPGQWSITVGTDML